MRFLKDFLDYMRLPEDLENDENYEEDGETQTNSKTQMNNEVLLNNWTQMSSEAQTNSKAHRDGETQMNNEAQTSENATKKEITVGQYVFLIGYAVIFLLIGWSCCYWFQSERLTAKDREIARLRDQYNLAVVEKEMVTDVSEVVQPLENAESPTVELIAQVDTQNAINIMIEDIHHLSNQIIREQEFIRRLGKVLTKEKDEEIRSYLLDVILTHRDIINAYKEQRNSYLSGMEKIIEVPEQVKNFDF